MCTENSSRALYPQLPRQPDKTLVRLGRADKCEGSRHSDGCKRKKWCCVPWLSREAGRADGAAGWERRRANVRVPVPRRWVKDIHSCRLSIMRRVTILSNACVEEQHELLDHFFDTFPSFLCEGNPVLQTGTWWFSVWRYLLHRFRGESGIGLSERLCNSFSC
eukprot:1362738-Amorphochlora_amoeboformis.AAC.3